MMTPESYIDSLYAEDELLERVKLAIVEQGMPSISVPAGYGRLLTMLVRMSGAKRVLEIGALGGLSGICIARGLKQDGQLVSLELQSEYAKLAAKHLDEAGFGEQVSYMVGDATESLKQLEQQGARFDFFFIDADKYNYDTYLDYAIKLANSGAVIAADNTLLRGKVFDDQAQGQSAIVMRKFNERIATDERLMSAILPAYDGMSLAIVK